MPPLVFPKNPNPNIVTINVGGQCFQTTIQTLIQAGPNTFFSKIFNSLNNNQTPFIDRDPELFSILLSLLRTGYLPKKSNLFSIQDIIFEANFYGIEGLLLESELNPCQNQCFDLEKCLLLPLNGRDSVSSVFSGSNGSVFVSHGSKISFFDWCLERKSTVLTEFGAVDSLLGLNDNVVVAGATDVSGLRVIDIESGCVEKRLDWENVTKTGSTVQGVGRSDEFLFCSFESSRRNSNAVLVYDLNDGFKVVCEIGHNEIFGADIGSAIPATKLSWIPSLNLLMASGNHSGPSGISGNVKFWDIRSGNLVSEIKETVDCFSDITVSDSLSSVFKVGMNSGEVSYIDFRNLSSTNSWNGLGDSRKSLNVKKEGFGCKIEAHGNQVFCTKEGEIELWSEVLMGSSSTTNNEKEERVFKKNALGRSKDIGGNRITNLKFGGNKMFVTRKEQQCVEVWQSSVRRF